MQSLIQQARTLEYRLGGADAIGGVSLGRVRSVRVYSVRTRYDSCRRPLGAMKNTMRSKLLVVPDYPCPPPPDQSEKASAALADEAAEAEAHHAPAKFGRLVVVYSGGGTVRATASIDSTQIGVLPVGSCAEYLQVYDHKGDGQYTTDGEEGMQ